MERDSGRFTPWQRVAFSLFAVSFGANQFAPLILVYLRHAGFSEQSVTSTFSIYVAGLVPALFVCGVWSDRVGRRVIVRSVLVLSLLASVLMLFGGEQILFLYSGRFLAGVASGAMFVVGSAWMQELAVDAPAGSGARLSATALSAGFGGGALISGALAQFGPAVFVVPYIPHLVIGAVAIAAVWNVPDVRAGGVGATLGQLVPPTARRPRFVFGVAIWAPLAFTCSSIAFISLPSIVAPEAFGVPVLFAGAITAFTLFTGVWVQPVARRLASSSAGWRLPVVGLGTGAVGLAGAAGLTVLRSPDLAAVLLIPVAFALGAGYGFLLIAGLVEVELQSGPGEYGRLFALFYALVYLGLAAPFLLSTLSGFGGPAVWLLAAAAVAVVVMIPTVRAGAASER